MDWLFKPRVQLGLFVNFAFIMFTLVSSAAGEHGYDLQPVPFEPHPHQSSPLPFVALPPPKGLAKATSYLDRNTGELNVYLENDIDLIRRPDFLLLLSPTFTVHDAGEMPRSVLLRFVSFSGAQYFAYDDSLTITADDVQVWPAVPEDGSQPFHSWSEERVPRSVTFGGDGRVVETVGKEIPYEVFIKIIRAKLVSIQLGPEAKDLTAEQLGALRDMHRRLSQTPEQTHKRL
jgi:hypothetical protein